MAGQQPPDSASQLPSASTAPAHSSAPPSSASGGSGPASSVASGGMSAPGGVGTTSSAQVTGTSASASNAPQHNALGLQQNASNPSSQVNLQSYQQSLQSKPANGLSHMQNQTTGQSSGTNSSAQQMGQQQNQHTSQPALGQSQVLAQQMLGPNQQQQGRQPQYSQNIQAYSQNAQASSQPQQGGSLQQQGLSTPQGQPLQNIPRVSSAQRLLQMQQPGGGNAGMRAATLGGGGAQYNQQLSPSLSASLANSPGAVQTSASSTSLQQQQQQQQLLLAQRNFQGQQQQQAGTPSQQRAPQITQQANQIAQQNQQHTSQSPQVQSPNQSLTQQVRPSLFSSSQQSVGSHLGHHLQQPGVASRLGTTGGGTMPGQGPGLPSMLPIPSAQPFAGMQSQAQQQALQGLPSMAMMGSAGHSASSSLPSQLSRAATPLMAQQQRIQQQNARLQQPPHQPPPQQQQPQQQSTIASPSKQQSSQQLPRVPSIGSSGSQMQTMAAAVQQNAALLPQSQSWFPAGQMKSNVNPAVPHHSQLPQAQLPSAQQRAQQPQAAGQQSQQQTAASPSGAAQLQLQQSQQVASQQQPSGPQMAGLTPGPTGAASTPIPPTPTTAQTPLPAPTSTQALSQQQQRVQGSAGQRPSTPVGPHLSSVQPAATSKGQSSQASDPRGKILGKRSIQDLVSQVDPGEKLDPDVEDVILEIADDFVETVTSFACALAKHRKSTTLEVKDVLLHLERNWHMTIPGFGGDDYRAYKKPSVSENHKHRLAVIRKSLASAHPAQEPKSAPVPTAQKANSGPQPAKPSQSTGPVTSPKLNRMH